jgi:glycerol-3-phosphate dehydrogenase
MNSPMHGTGTDIFDVAVVGAGVVGCAIARRFTLEGARVAVVEKAHDILDGASKANSAILHTGFDAPPGSLELSCIRDGYREYTDIHHEMGLPLEKTGAFVVAWNDNEIERLDAVVAQARENGFDDLRLIEPCELRRREPNLSARAQAAVEVVDESIIDPWSAPYAYMRQALENGAAIFLSCEVTGGEFGGGLWQLETSRGALKCRHVVNCAGLHGDTLDLVVLGAAKFRIRPRKGQFVVFDKAASKLLTSIILPVPTSKTKGVVVSRTVFGNVLVGPTAEDQDSRTDTSTDEATLGSLLKSASGIIPALENMPVTAIYAGLRPATEYKDYRIEAEPDRNWITVGGIRSTGLSGALGIARHVFGLYSKRAPDHVPVRDPGIPRIPVLAEKGPRDWQRENHGGIVCHCELVTEREVRDALTGPLAARSLSGLKRQTRVTMGRCQGFYCSARLAELTVGRFSSSLSLEASHA